MNEPADVYNHSLSQNLCENVGVKIVFIFWYWHFVCSDLGADDSLCVTLEPAKQMSADGQMPNSPSSINEDRVGGHRVLMKASELPQFSRWGETFGLIGVERIRGFTHTDVHALTLHPHHHFAFFFSVHRFCFPSFCPLLFTTRTQELMIHYGGFLDASSAEEVSCRHSEARAEKCAYGVLSLLWSCYSSQTLKYFIYKYFISAHVPLLLLQCWRIFHMKTVILCSS